VRRKRYGVSRESGSFSIFHEIHTVRIELRSNER
jgi:hypothetical protein